MKKLKLMVLALASLVGRPVRGETMLLANEKTAKPADYWKRKTAMAIGKPDLAEGSDDDLEKAHDAHMVAMANEDTDTPAALANEETIKKLAAKKKPEATEEEQVEESEEVKLANERVTTLEKEAAELLIGSAITAGRILPAARKDWVAKFANDFDSAKGELEKEAKKLKTTAVAKDLGKGNHMSLANESARRTQWTSLVNAEKAKNGGDYDLACATVQQEHPELFAQMKQPATVSK